MFVDTIIKYGNDLLQKPTEPIKEINDEIRQLISRMYQIMAEASGVGLAANQIGIPKRLFVYDVGEGPHALINPKLVKSSGAQIGVEGCLSVPGLQGEVARANLVVVVGLDENGEPVKIKADGLLARVFQHETDHLDGHLFIEKADPDTLELIKPESEAEEQEL